MTEPVKKIPAGPKPLKTAGKPKPVDKEAEPVERSAPPEPPVARDLRRMRSRRLVRRLGLGVGVPTVLAAIYYAGIATPQYESLASFTIQSAESSAPGGFEFLIASVPGGGAARDTVLVQQYVQSRDVLQKLIEEHGFLEHYSNPDVDYLSRLAPDAPFEDVYEYYQDKVVAEYDTHASVITLRVRAFRAEKAHEIAHAILGYSEAMVNRMMDQARQDQISLAQREVQRAEERLSGAREELLRLQADRAEINPAASAEAVLTVRSTLEAELAQARAELGALRATLQPGAPQLVTQQQRVVALTRQVEQQTRRLAASGNDDALSADIAAFEPAVAEKEFAQHAYESALKSLELARLDSSRQHRYLVTIARPSEPDEATHPRVFIAVLTVFVLSFALLGIGSLLLASVREHANL